MVFYTEYSTFLWLKTFHHKLESSILNNGWASGFFPLHRGEQQGGPLFPYLFVLSAEMLVKAIRRNTAIKGLDVKESVECVTISYTYRKPCEEIFCFNDTA